jgi:peptidoglycan/LPS O-acetylase OafA/YrhL
MNRDDPEPAEGSSAASPGEHAHAARLGSLDGWRAISIIGVLSAHMLPLGPSRWGLNALAGDAGMTLFFTLSGFLIASTLERNPTVPSFLIRRICRIAPLALLASVIYLLIQRKGLAFYPPHLLFYLNYDDPHLTELTGPFWSLAVEVQFYAMAALAFGLWNLRGLVVLATLGLAITALRVFEHDPISIRTHLRVDEILSGVSLSLVYSGRLGMIGRGLVRLIRAVPLSVWAVAFVVASHRSIGPPLYIRNYLAVGLVGRTLLVDDRRLNWLRSRPLRYIAEISYALYVIHELTIYGWFSSGGKVTKYLKRILSFGLLIGLAHLSTFAYERPWIAFGKQRARHWDARREPIKPREPGPLLDPSLALDDTAK